MLQIFREVSESFAGAAMIFTDKYKKFLLLDQPNFYEPPLWRVQSCIFLSRPLFFIYFVFSKYSTEKFNSQQDSNWGFRVEGKDADHYTTTTAHKVAT